MKFVRVATHSGTAWFDVNVDDLLLCEFHQSSGSCWHTLTFKSGHKQQLYITPEQAKPLYKVMGLDDNTDKSEDARLPA